MSNQRTTFLKRNREADRKDKATQKAQRLAAARGAVKTTKGPVIDWNAAVTETDSSLESPDSPNTNTNNSASPAAPAVKPTTPPVKPT